MYGQVSTKEKKMERKETNTRDRKKKTQQKLQDPAVWKNTRTLLKVTEQIRKT